MKDDFYIRLVSTEDADALLKIYEPYVLNTAITFEYQVPSPEEFRNRIEGTLRRYPYIVVCRDQEILGYAYTGALNVRKAYDWSAETSIYVREDMHGQGLGRLLYTCLEDISKAQNITNLYACIGYPEKEDEYLTFASASFHQHMGYKFIGKFQRCGYKFARWYDMIWMEKIIAEHKSPAAEFIPFPSLPPILS